MICQSIARKAGWRTVECHSKLPDSTGFGSAQKPTFIGKAAPIIFSFGNLKRLGGAPWIPNGFPVDASPHIETAEAETYPFVLRIEEVRNAVLGRLGPGADLLKGPRIIRPKVIDDLMLAIQVDGVFDLSEGGKRETKGAEKTKEEQSE
jgi:hypothetical protein